MPEDKPFFLYFGFNQPHRGFSKEHEEIDPEKLSLPQDWPALPEVRIDYARYLNEVRDLDRGFGMVLDVLKEKKLEENTLVIFMGDNGEALLRGKGTLYDRGTHVPLIVRWPNRIEEGSQSEALISGIDLSATILEAAGLEMHETMDGLSFLPQLLGIESKPRTHLFAERGWHWGPITRTDGLDFSRSVTSTRYRYIYNALPDRSYTPVDMSKKMLGLPSPSLTGRGNYPNFMNVSISRTQDRSSNYTISKMIRWSCAPYRVVLAMRIPSFSYKWSLSDG